MSKSAKSIAITENGPYLVSGLPLSRAAIQVDDAGNSWTWRNLGEIDVEEQYALCRCGRSEAKPFCDGSHAAVAFKGSETASQAPYSDQAERFEGPTMDLDDARALCAFARFCDGFGGVWNGVTETDREGARELLSYEASQCPSGRLVARDKSKDASAVEPSFEPSIVLVEDPAKAASGPIWVRGEVDIASVEHGSYEPRNRMTLCRCGESTNKPFCDGTHAHIGFNDDSASKSQADVSDSVK